jgi:hypothetical protein
MHLDSEQSLEAPRLHQVHLEYQVRESWGTIGYLHGQLDHPQDEHCQVCL